MSKIRIFRQRVKRLDAKRFTAIGRDLGATGEVVETEEAIAMIGKEGKTLAYAQPGARFAGLLFYTDQSQNLGEVADRLTGKKRAEEWTRKFLEGHDLLPKLSSKGDAKAEIAFEVRTPDAYVYDGRERKAVATRLEVAAKLALDGLPVTGPRGKLRLSFKADETPVAVHRGVWQDLEVFEEREAVSEDEGVKTAVSRLEARGTRGRLFRLVSAKRAYWAREYEGGADLLEPHYFVEVEFEDREARKHGIEQGPRQVFVVPASR
jgi:hypothetical protein